LLVGTFGGFRHLVLVDHTVENIGVDQLCVDCEAYFGSHTHVVVVIVVVFRRLFCACCGEIFHPFLLYGMQKDTSTRVSVTGSLRLL